jgi:hypothetical protein
MTITFTDDTDFYNGISTLVHRSLMFEANFDDLTITLTGGY